MEEIKSKDQVTKRISDSEKKPILFYKHSNRCPICEEAKKEVQKFNQKHPEIPCVAIDVIESREASNFLSEESGIKHESPQTILYHHETPVWHASHREITLDTLEKKLSKLLRPSK